MDTKFLIDGKEERTISGVLPSEGSIVELKKDGKSKLYLHLHRRCYFKTYSFVSYADAGCPDNEFVSITPFRTSKNI